MLLHDNTYKQQSKLARYCKTGKLENTDGLNAKNVSHYRRLVFNVVDDMVENAFPLFRTLLSNEEWNILINDFFSNHACQSPQVWYMPKEFLEYIEHTNHSLNHKFPFLKDLLLFEWMDTEVFMMPDQSAEHKKLGDINTDAIVLNPEHYLLAFQYPVHKKHPSELTEKDKGNYFVIMYRNEEDDVLVNELTPAFARMFEYLAEEPLSIKQLLGMFTKEFELTLTSVDEKMLSTFLQQALSQNLILGFK